MTGKIIQHDPAAHRGTVEVRMLNALKDQHACMSVRLGIAVLCTSVLASCMALRPSASLNPPNNRLTHVKSTAWLKQVLITDSELDNQEHKLQLETTLTNNLLRFLRDGKYFVNVELLPGKPQPDDIILLFEFDRYRQKRYAKVFHSSDTSDLSATLTISRPDGQVVKNVSTSLKEEHAVAPFAPQATFPSGMAARTQVIEDLLQKALMASIPGP